MLQMIAPYVAKSHEAGQLRQSIALHEMMLEEMISPTRGANTRIRSVRANMDHFRQTLELTTDKRQHPTGEDET